MAGVAATDWSWCPIFLDIDLDGYEDLLISNGFESDVMDQDRKDDLRNPQRRLTRNELRRNAGILSSLAHRQCRFPQIATMARLNP